MAKANNSTHWTLAGLFLCFMIPLFVGTVLYNDQYLGSATNRGQFPPSHTTLRDLKIDVKTSERKWLVLIWQQDPCEQTCQEHIDGVRKLHILTRNDQTRIRTAFASNSSNQAPPLPPGMLPLSHTNSPLKWLQSNQRMIIDPKGNIVLTYQEKQSLEDTLKDLKRLLKYNRDFEA